MQAALFALNPTKIRMATSRKQLAIQML